MQKLSCLLLLAAILDVSILAQETVLRVYEDPEHRTHVVNKNGQVASIAAGVGQVGIDSIQISRNGHTAGWLVLYSNADSGRPDAGVLVLWRNGKVIRRFHSEQAFWSWSLPPGGDQVAYHVGPTHGEVQSHCELHEVESGRLLESWDGDLADAHRPSWVKTLGH